MDIIKSRAAFMVGAVVAISSMAACSSPQPSAIQPAAASSHGTGQTTARPLTTYASATTGELGTLYGKLIAACEAAPQTCAENISGGQSGPGSDALAFCSRFIEDAKSVLVGSGALDPQGGGQSYAYAADEIRVNLNSDDTVQGGGIDPDGNSAGCITPVNPGGFAVWLSPAPPAQINYAGNGTTKLTFGHPCITSVSSQYGSPSLDLTCVTGNGWAFDVVEAHQATVPSTLLQQTFNTLAADL